MKTVLCVDDSPTIRKIVAKAMKQLRFKKILEAENGQVALDVLAENAADLVVLDINMPVMNGVEFLENRKKDENLMKIPVIILTTEGDNPTLVETAMELGANAYCSKPFQLREMKKNVVKVLLKK
jgi:two-component system, chemotaxis family, chemotaxis protein CheY